MADGQVVIDITGDTSRYNAAVDSIATTTKSRISSLGSGISSIGSAITNKITVPATAAASALSGVVLAKGWARLEEIDTAKAKLAGLGKTAEDITSISNSALASVKGTAYSMSEAVTTAATATAAGVAQGADLTRYLSLVADAAAVAGTDMSSMGDVFNKVQTIGAAYNDSLQQLADQGIPIYSWLSEELGISTSDVQDWASKGKISTEMFLQAVQDNIGGAAKTMGELSMSGIISNIWASVGRIGANFLDAEGKGNGFFTQLKPLLIEFKDWLGKVEDKAGELGAVFGEKFAGIVTTVKNLLANLDPSKVEAFAKAFVGIAVAGPVLKLLGSIISNMATVITPIVGIAGKFFGAFVDGAGKAISAVASFSSRFVGAAGAAVSAFSSSLKAGFDSMDLGSVIEGKLLKVKLGCEQVFSGIGEKIGEFFLPAVAAIEGKLSPIVDKAKSIAETVVLKFSYMKDGLTSKFADVADVVASALFPITSKVGPIIEGIGTKFSSIKETVSDKLSGIGEAISSKLAPLQTAFGDIANKVGNAASSAASAFKEKFNIGSSTEGEADRASGALSKIGTAASGLGKGVAIAGGVLGAMAAGLLGIGMAAAAGGVDLQAMADKVTTFMAGITANLPSLAEQAATILPQLVEQVVAALPAFLAAIQQAMTTIITMLPTILPSLVTGIVMIVTQLAVMLIQMAPTLLAAGMQLFTQLLLALADSIPMIIAQLPTLISQLVTTLTANAPALLSAALTLFIALVEALVQIIPPLIEQLPTMMDQIVSCLIQMMPILAQAAVTLFLALVQAVPQILDALGSAFSDLLGYIPGWISDAAGALYDAAGQMMQGMLEGIGDSAGAVWDKITSVCSGALDAVKDFFGIHSPSRVMRYWWKFVPMGAALGVDDGAPSVVKSMSSMMTNAIEAVNADGGIDIPVDFDIPKPGDSDWPSVSASMLRSFSANAAVKEAASERGNSTSTTTINNYTIEGVDVSKDSKATAAVDTIVDVATGWRAK